MTAKTIAKKSRKELEQENEELRIQLAEAQETLHAIRSGQVDAVVVSSEQGQQVYTLKGADQTYRLLMEQMSEGAVITDLAGDIFYCNRRFADMVKLPLEQVIGVSIGRFVSSDGRAAFDVLLERCRKDSYVGEAAFRADDGTTIPVQISARGLKLADLAGLSLIVTDLTEQKRRESERLADVEAERRRLFGVLETLPVIVALFRPDYRIVWVNRAYREALGDNVGSLCYAAQFGRDKPCDECQAFFPLKTGQPQHWEWTLPNGRTFDIYNFRFADTDGSPLILEMDIDITERRQAEAALKDLNETLQQRVAEQTASLRESEERFRVAQELSPDGFTIMHPVRDAQGQIVDFAWVYENAAIGRLNGTDPQAVVGRRLSEVMPSHAHSPFDKVYREVAETGQSRVLEAMFQGDSLPRPTWFRVAVVPLGKDIAILAQDVTDRRRAEEELQKAKDELEQRVRERTSELEQAVAELKRSNADLEQFAYVSSHDLQEPLRMVASYVGLLEQRYMDKLDEDAKTFIGFAVEGAVRMQGLIKDLLAYSRVQSRAQPFAPVDCEKLLETVERNLEIPIRETGAVITHDSLPTVPADEPQLMQVFQNLVDNAIKFRRPGVTPKVHIRAERRGDEWVFSVADNGIGIEPQYRDRIFVIFQRLHTRQKYPGSGIGLAIVKRIVERHGGRVCLESEPGTGSTFCFTIPVTGSKVTAV